MAKESARPTSELDLNSRNELERILTIDPAAMNRHEQGFMRARVDYLNKEQKADYVDNVEPIEDEPEPEAEDSYHSWNGADLKAELVARGLPVSGNNHAKATRLEEDDAKEDEDASEGE